MGLDPNSFLNDYQMNIQHNKFDTIFFICSIIFIFYTLHTQYIVEE